MKKRFGKTILGIAALFLAVGIGLSIAGRAMGGETSMEVNTFGHTYSINLGILSMGIHNGNRSGGDARTDGAQDLEAFRTLNVDLDMGDVVIKQGDSYGVALEWSGKGYELHWTNENGALEVWSTNNTRNIVNLGGYDATVTITVPQGARFDSAYIQADLGKADISGFYAADLNVEADLGDVNLWNVQAESTVLTLSMGSLTIDTLATGTLDVTADMGNVEGRDLEVRDSLTAEAGMGSVDLRGDLRTYASVIADMGSIRLDTELSADECNYEFTVDMGTISVDGKDYGDVAIGGSGSNLFTGEASMGGIELNFKG